MANHKSALKRARQNEERRLRNKAVRTRLRSAVKDVRSKTGDAAAQALVEAQSVIDKAVKKGVVHKRTAARKVSRLKKMVDRGSAS